MALSSSDAETLDKKFKTVKDPSHLFGQRSTWNTLYRRRREAIDEIREILNNYSMIGQCSVHQAGGVQNPGVVPLALLEAPLNHWNTVNTDMSMNNIYLCWECMRALIEDEDWNFALKRILHIAENIGLPDQVVFYKTSYRRLEPHGMIIVRNIPDVDVVDEDSCDDDYIIPERISTPTFESENEILDISTLLPDRNIGRNQD
ncbi:23K protein 4 [Zostera-associated varicosavirus 1]|uniref:23K protein 4 n=1 Tax=Zostera-associated varicosavirus 1 TaxID=3071325 RepID=UPI001E79E961|nr:23K protein 4 [Zostera-associated varicosavirus 1]DAZ85732.1 TPA_asm: 23K protein 4 [Zostera-associated varicosavirus 1]